MGAKYLDLNGLTRYDNLIKQYISSVGSANVGIINKQISAVGGSFSDAEIIEAKKPLCIIWADDDEFYIKSYSVDLGSNAFTITFTKLAGIGHDASNNPVIDGTYLTLNTSTKAYTYTAVGFNLSTALAGKKDDFTFSYAGVTTTALSQGSTTSTIVVNSLDVVAVEGLIAKSGTTYFIWNGTSWQTLSDVPVDTAITNSEIDALFS